MADTEPVYSLSRLRHSGVMEACQRIFTAGYRANQAVFELQGYQEYTLSADEAFRLLETAKALHQQAADDLEAAMLLLEAGIAHEDAFRKGWLKWSKKEK